jgi:nucleoside-diphosphate-sugar epimerase
MTHAPIVLLGPGYSCQALARRASEAGYPLFGSARTAESGAALDAAGITPFSWDASRTLPGPEHLELPPGCAVVYSVPTLFESYEPAAPGALARHVEPVEAALQWAIERDAHCFIYLSSSSVYGDHQGAEVDESSACSPISPYGHMRLDIERHLLDRVAPLDVYVARLVGIYGPGRTIVDSIRAGRYRVVDPTKPTNRIHVEDIAQTLLALIERGPRGPRLYNVCDGSPVPVGELIDVLVEEFGVEPPPSETIEQVRARAGVNSASRWEASYRCLNQRMISELGITLRYPDAIAGYRAILSA